MIKVRIDDISEVVDTTQVKEIITSRLGWGDGEVDGFLADLPSFCYVGDDSDLANNLVSELKNINVKFTTEGLDDTETAQGEETSQSSNLIKVYGNMDWFSVAEQPDDIDVLPEEFSEMKQLWDSDSEANMKKIVDELSPYIGGRFVADNLDGWEDYFSDESFGEFEAEKIRVVGFDFSEEPLPLCKVEAWFNVALKEGVSKEDVKNWIMDSHEGELYSAIVFNWELDEIDELEDLDLTVGDHNGCEAEIVDS